MTKPAKTILGDLCTIIDCEHKTAPTEDSGIPLIRTPNIGRGRLILNDVQRISERTYRIWSRRGEPMPGDLIMAREAPVGNVAIVPANEKVCLGQRTVLLRVKDEHVDSGYLNYLLNSTAMNAYVNLLSNGATVGHLNVSDIRKLKLPSLPKTDSQRKIAAILTAYDDLIENNRRRIEVLEKLLHELYREWFVRLRFPGHGTTKVVKGVPNGWEVRRLGSFADEIKQGVKKKNLANDEKYVGLEHIPRRSIVLRTWTTADTVESDKLLFQERDILFAKIRPYLHKVALAHFSGACSSDTIVLRPKEKYYEGYLLFTVFSDTFIELATVASKGTKMPRADWSFLKKLELIVPHEGILKRYQAQFDIVFRQIANLLSSNQLLSTSRDLLLPRLISGRLAVENLEIQFPPGMMEEFGQTSDFTHHA